MPHPVQDDLSNGALAVSPFGCGFVVNRLR